METPIANIVLELTWTLPIDKRSIDPNSILESGSLLESRASLESRALLDVLFPDNLGAALGCPTDFTSDTGDCNAAIPGDYGQILKRDDSSNVVYEVLANTTEVPTGDVLFRRAIEKRSSKDPFFYCNVASWLVSLALSLITWQPQRPRTYGSLTFHDFSSFSNMHVGLAALSRR